MRRKNPATKSQKIKIREKSVLPKSDPNKPFSWFPQIWYFLVKISLSLGPLLSRYLALFACQQLVSADWYPQVQNYLDQSFSGAIQVIRGPKKSEGRKLGVQIRHGRIWRFWGQIMAQIPNFKGFGDLWMENRGAPKTPNSTTTDLTPHLWPSEKKQTLFAQTFEHP